MSAATVDFSAAVPNAPVAALPGAPAGFCTAAELTAGVRAGDEAAFREFHARYAPRLLRYALVVAHGDLHRAGETVQSTFLRAIRHLRVIADESALWAWLARAARCASADAARRESRHGSMIQRLTRLFDSAPALPPAVEAPEHVWMESLEAALAELEPDERALIDARYFRRESLADTAAFCGTSERAIEGRLARLRSRLREAVLRHLNVRLT